MRVGLSQRLRIEWLELAANASAAGKPKVEIIAELDAKLSKFLSKNSEAGKGNRAKTLSNISVIWLESSPVRKDMLKDALNIYKSTSSKYHFPLHWAMTMAAYPFFSKVARATGALIKLQGEARYGQIERKLVEELGDRQTVTRSAQRIVRSMHDWGVLRDTKIRGAYKLKRGYPKACAPQMQAFLVEALLHENPASSRNFNELVQDPALFPFQIDNNLSVVQRKNSRIITTQQSLDEAMVGI